MENNEINPKPQSTGGLKLLTVFIAVLALHVVVIGGFTVYHLMSGGGTDADLVSDKVHKGVKVTPDSATVSDGPLPDGMNPDKNATASTTPADVTTPMTIPAPPSTPAPSDASETAAASPAAAPAPATASSGPTASVPSGPIQSGPVISPPASSAPAANVAAESPTANSAPAGGNAAANAAPGTSGGMAYVVKKHDTMARIAHQHHIKIAALRSANGLKNDFLHIGQKLVIPAQAHEEASGLAALREPNTTLLGDSIPDEAKPMTSTAHDKAAMASSTGGRHTYTVSKGDTLTRIARKFHTTSSALMTLNNISDARKLRLGQKLKIPTQEARSATSAPAPAPPPDRIEPRATPTAQLANFIP